MSDSSVFWVILSCSTFVSKSSAFLWEGKNIWNKAKKTCTPVEYLMFPDTPPLPDTHTNSFFFRFVLK